MFEATGREPRLPPALKTSVRGRSSLLRGDVCTLTEEGADYEPHRVEESKAVL